MVLVIKAHQNARSAHCLFYLFFLYAFRLRFLLQVHAYSSCSRGLMARKNDWEIAQWKEWHAKWEKQKLHHRQEERMQQEQQQEQVQNRQEQQQEEQTQQEVQRASTPPSTPRHFTSPFPSTPSPWSEQCWQPNPAYMWPLPVLWPQPGQPPPPPPPPQNEFNANSATRSSWQDTALTSSQCKSRRLRIEGSWSNQEKGKRRTEQRLRQAERGEGRRCRKKKGAE